METQKGHNNKPLGLAAASPAWWRAAMRRRINSLHQIHSNFSLMFEISWFNSVILAIL